MNRSLAKWRDFGEIIHACGVTLALETERIMVLMIRLIRQIGFIPLIFCAASRGQWLDYPTPGIPRTPEGKPNLTAPAPKAADGHSDLSGLWQRARGQANQRVVAGLAMGPNLEDFMRPGEKIPPMIPAAEALYKQRQANFMADRPSASCLPHGIPDQMLIRVPMKIVQNPGLTLILYEEFARFRQIFTDGRPLLSDPNPTWNGYSTGKWDGDVLVVQTNGFRDGTWLDAAGNPLTEAAKIRERFRRLNFGQLEIELTVDDPTAYRSLG